jgi:DNA-binding beta-propeller fold protein YncE
VVAYVTTEEEESTVVVIDTVAGAVSGTLPLPAQHWARALALTADGSFIYVAGYDANGAGQLLVVDTAREELAGTVSLGARPWDVVVAGFADGTPTPSPSLPSTATPMATETPPPDRCPGDCDGDEEVTVDEVVTAVRTAKDQDLMGECPPCDVNRDQQVTVDELVAAVRSALTGCAP